MFKSLPVPKNLFVNALNLISKKNTLLVLFLWFSISTVFAQSAIINVDAAGTKGLLFRAEGYNNVSGVVTGAATRPQDYAFMVSQGLRPKVLRCWISETIYNRTSGVYSYASYDSYLSDVSNYADTILICLTGNSMVEAWQYTPDQCKPIVKEIVKHFKANFPKIKYLEVLNEPDLYGGTVMTPAKTYSYYKPIAQAVDEINAELNPAIKLLVGGPAISSLKYSQNWITQFLDDYKNDASADKRLDFLSFHTYSYKSSPKDVDDIAATVKNMLSTRSIPTSTPTLITETGLFPGDDVSGTAAQDALSQAAGMAAYTYWYTNTANNLVPFNWVLRHADYERKDQIVTRPKSYSDRLTPYGNMLKMMGMMKTQKLDFNSNAIDGDGFGVYGLASSDATGISVMAWNYQHTRTKDYGAVLNVNNLPAIFSGKSIRRKIYKIDQTTSNNYYNVNNCNLQLVSDTTLANVSALTLNLGVMSENSMQLVVLEPVNSTTDPFALTAKLQGTSAVLNWSTQTEVNSANFQVSKSSDGAIFNVIGTINAAGNSSAVLPYSFTDYSPTIGSNYYRITQVNVDHSTISSKDVMVHYNLIEGAADIYYSFGSTGAETGNVTSGTPTGWNVGALTAGNTIKTSGFFSSTSVSNSYSAFSAQGNVTTVAKQGSLNGKSVTYSGVTTNIPATGISGLSYFEVILTPKATDKVKIDHLSFGSRSIGSSGGPANVIIRSSVDGFSTNLYAQDINTGSAWVLVAANLSSPIIGTTGNPVTLRIYANDAVGNSNPSTNNWRIDDLIIAVITDPVLPQLNSLTVSATSTTATKLTWQTTSETNTTTFNVQRSTDGTTFTTIGNVTAAGNSASIKNYVYNDNASLAGVSYYRIAMNSSTAPTVYSDAVGIYIAAGDNNDIYYNFGTTDFETGNVSSGLPAGWIASPVSIGNSTKTSDFFTSTSATASYTAASKQGNATLAAKQGSLNGRSVTYNSVTTNIPATGIGALSYFEVTLTPSAAEKVKLGKIAFGSRSIGSSGGPANVIIRSSVDGYASNIYTGDILTTSTWQLITVNLASPLTGSTGLPVTLRFYANDAVGNTANSWRIDDLSLTVINTQTTLPISLTYFTAKALTEGVKLTWTTATERNNSHFEILRAVDRKNFIKIGTVNGNNNSSSAINYTFLDTKPVQGTSYYQLKQVDFNGDSEIFGPLAVKNSFISNELKVFATENSVELNLTSATAGTALISLVDLNGRKILSRSTSLFEGQNQISLPATLAKGVYLVTIAGVDFSAVKKFIK